MVFLLLPLCCTKAQQQKYMKKAEDGIRQINEAMGITPLTDDEDDDAISMTSVRKNRVEPVNYGSMSSIIDVPPAPKSEPPKRQNPYANMD